MPGKKGSAELLVSRSLKPKADQGMATRSE